MPHKSKNPGVGTGHGVKEPKERICQDCSNQFLAVRSDALRCPDCKLAHEAELARQARVHRVAKRGAWRPQDVCPTCGGSKDRQATTCFDCIPRGGVNNANWKGGRVKNGGYIAIRRPRGTARYTMEHIAVWEDANGPTPPHFNIHHLNGIKSDNRLENLIGLPEHEHHSYPHKAIVPYEERIRILEARLRSAGLPID